MTELKMISDTEFRGAHAATLAALDAERDRIVEAAQRDIGAAKQKHYDTLATLLPAHEAAIEERTTAFQHWAAATLAPDVESMRAEPSRLNVAKLATAFTVYRDEALRVLGQAPDADRQPELWMAIAHAAATAVPGGIARIANENHHSSLLNSGIGYWAHQLTQTFQRIGDLPGQAAAYAELEKAIMVVVTSYPPVPGDAAARWEIHRFGGTIEGKAKLLAALNRVEFIKTHGSDAERQEKHTQMQEAQRTKEPGESLVGAIARVAAAAKQLLTPSPVPAVTTNSKARRAERAASMDPQPGDDDALSAHETEAAEDAAARANSLSV